jgi:hypothetical protein
MHNTRCARVMLARGPQTCSLLQFFVCSFAMNSFLLTEGGILRDLGVTLLIITGGPLITELLVTPTCYLCRWMNGPGMESGDLQRKGSVVS